MSGVHGVHGGSIHARRVWFLRRHTVPFVWLLPNWEVPVCAVLLLGAGPVRRLLLVSSRDVHAAGERLHDVRSQSVCALHPVRRHALQDQRLQLHARHPVQPVHVFLP